jgi:sugar phosphate isomerase/epimerase
MLGAQIAVQTVALRQPLRQALHTASRCGCQGVQIDARHQLRPTELTDTAARQLRKIADDLNLRVASIHFPNRRGLAEATDLQRRVEALADALRMASRLGARTLVCSLGPLPSADAPQRQTLEEVLLELANLGDRHGVRTALEPGTADPQQLLEILAPLSYASIGVDFSPADLILNQQSAVEFLNHLGDRVAHVRANDAVSGMSQGGGQYVVLGRGLADFPELLGLLEQHDYRSWITIDPRGAADPAQAVDDAVAFLRAL